MAPNFTIEYDDFSGGYFLGPRGTDQPRNTWQGENMTSPAGSGMLMPSDQFQVHSSLLSSYGGVAVPGSSSGFVTAGSAWQGFGTATSSTSFSTGLGGGIGFGVRPVAFQGKFVAPDYAAARVSIWTGSGAATLAATPVIFGVFGAWNEFLLGAGGYAVAQPQRLYYSAPADPASWTSSDYYDVGETGAAIRCIIPVGGELLIGKDDGWYAINGVLGDTATIRKVNPVGPLAGSWTVAPAAATPDSGVVFVSRTASVSILRGSIVSDYLHMPTERFFRDQPTDIGLVGQHLVLANSNSGSGLYVKESSTGFTRYACEGPIITASSYGTSKLIAFGGSAAKQVLLDQIRPGHSASKGVVAGPSSGYFSATAQLAEYRHRSPFEIQSAVAEVELDNVYGAGTVPGDSTASITLRMFANAQPEGSAAMLGTVTSAPAQETVSTSSAPRGERKTVRLSPNDAPRSISIIPSVTLKGCKLRRLIIACREAGAA